MALIVQTSLTEAKDCKSISLLDITGVYNASTNPSGYGALQVPIGLREVTDVVGAILQISIPKSEIVDGIVYIDQTDAQTYTDGVTPYVISNPDFSNNTSNESIPDGVYKTNYIVLFDTEIVSNRIGVVNGSNIITCLDSNTAQFEGATHIIIAYNTSDQFIAEIAAISGDEITITEEYTGNTATIAGGGYLAGYGAIAYIAARGLINSCLHTKIAAISTETCSCKSSKICSLCEALTLYYGIEANMDFERYTHAQTIIDYLTTYCSSDDCNC